MERIRIAGVLLGLALLSACAHDRRALTKDQTLKNIWEQPSDAETIRLRGIGAAPPNATGETQRRGLARQAALASARYEGLALLRGIKVTGGISVEKLMEKDSRITEIANAVISGLEEVQTEWTSDSGCVVLLELKRSQLDKMLMDARIADSADAYRTSLEEQVRITDARAYEQRSRLPGMAVAR